MTLTNGKEVLVIGKQMYYKHTQSKCGFRWRCARHREGCRANVHIDNFMNIVKSLDSHNHNSLDFDFT